MRSLFLVQAIGIASLLVTEVATSPVPAAEPTGRVSLAVDLFAVPEGLKRTLAPSVLTDLLLEAGKKSPRYEQLVPNEYLRKVLDRHRLALQAGQFTQPPEDVEPKKILAERVLLPAVSKIGEKYYVTAALIDTRSFKRIESYKLDGRGEDALPGLIEELWKQVDAARTRWTYAADGPLVLGPLVRDDWVVLVTGKHWACVDAGTGRELWKHPVTQPPPIPADPKAKIPPRRPGRVQLVVTAKSVVLVTHQFVGFTGAQITLESRDLAGGKSLWTRTTADPFSRWLSASKSHVFYVEHNFDLVALDALTGEEEWKRRLPAERVDTYTLTATSDDRLYAIHPSHFLSFDPTTGKPVTERTSIWEGAHHPVARRVELKNLLQVGNRLYGYQGGKCYALHESGTAGNPQPLIPTPPAGGSKLYPQEEPLPLVQDGTRVFFAATRELWHGVPGLSDARFERVELHVSARTLNGAIELVWHRPVASSNVRGRAVGPVVHGDMVLVGLRDHVYGLDHKTGQTVVTIDIEPPLDTDICLARGALVVGDTAGTVRAIEP